MRRVRRPFCCYARTTRRGAGTTLRSKHLRPPWAASCEPKEMDRSHHHRRDLARQVGQQPDDPLAVARLLEEADLDASQEQGRAGLGISGSNGLLINRSRLGRAAPDQFTEWGEGQIGLMLSADEGTAASRDAEGEPPG